MRALAAAVVSSALALAGCRGLGPVAPVGTQPVGEPCRASEECALPASACMVAVCSSRTCAHRPAPPGALDGRWQSAGDCKVAACDGVGRVTSIEAPADVPDRPTSECTTWACTAEGPREVPRPVGSPCSTGTCTANGACGTCAPGAERCGAAGVERCGEDGQWSPREACSASRPVCTVDGAKRPRCIGATDVAVGQHHACLRVDDGSIRCWGADDAGQLGASATPRAELSWLDEGLFAVGPRHGCAFDAEDTLACWGSNDFGQLGAGDFVSRVQPARVPDLAGVIAVGVGRDHTCAVHQGFVSCWGRNDRGQLGNKLLAKEPLAPRLAMAVPPGRAEPRAPAGVLRGARSLHLGGAVTCARHDAGATCFGRIVGALPEPIVEPQGKGDAAKAYKARLAATSRSPVEILGLEATQVACGGDTSCAVDVEGQVWCWGAGDRGQLGQGSSDAAKPERVPGVEGALKLAMGEAFACATTVGQRVLCWGANERGQLGRGVASAAGAPAEVPLKRPVTWLGAGAAFVCVLTDEQEVLCWGDGRSGQLGPGAKELEPSPRRVVW